jgi:hypothetical protein
MLTFDLGPLAERLGCEAEVAAYTGPFVGWRFLGAILREKPDADAETKAVVDPVIAGMDLLARGEDWLGLPAVSAPYAARAAVEAAHAAYGAQTARRTAAAAAAVWAAQWAAEAGLTYARQREMLLEMMKEAE